MFGSTRTDTTLRLSLDRIEGWTRERFTLADDAVVMVSQVDCAQPGCPPLETVVAFWTAPDARHHFKVFKQAADVVPDDVPFAWMRSALRADGAGDCC